MEHTFEARMSCWYFRLLKHCVLKTVKLFLNTEFYIEVHRGISPSEALKWDWSMLRSCLLYDADERPVSHS